MKHKFFIGAIAATVILGGAVAAGASGGIHTSNNELPTVDLQQSVLGSTIDVKQTGDKAKDIISAKTAEKIALSQAAGIVEDIELDRENGRLIYEVEIENGDSDCKVYIDAHTGKVLYVKVDDDNKSNKENIKPDNNAKVISKKEAAAIALNQASGVVEDIEVEKKNGQFTYEVEIENGDNDVEVFINAYTGEVLYVKKDSDSDDDVNKKNIKQEKTKQDSVKPVVQKEVIKPSNTSFISVQKAVEIAEKETGGKVIEIDRDDDDGQHIYEIELFTNKGEVEIELDAVSGKIQKIEYED